jgi:hypothetical protein
MRNLLAILMYVLAVSFASSADAAPAARTAAPAIPDSPAGRVFRAWFDAFNSGDRAQIEAYYKKYEPTQSAQMVLGFRRRVGGFDLVEVRDSKPNDLVVQLKERNSPTNAIAGVHVKPGNRPSVVSFVLIAIPPGMSPEQMNVTVDAALRARIIDHIAAKLTEFYIYPDVAKKMVDAMRAHQKKGDYDSITDGYAFASRLTGDLKAVSHDGHLRVGCSPRPVPPDDPADDDQSREQPASPEFVELMHQRNCAVVKVEHLPPNIGYIQIDGFFDRKTCGPTITSAFALVQYADALILDLRDNGGGSPEMVSYVASYLFAKRTHINDLYYRHGNKTTQYWTDPTVPGAKFVGKPVYVLASNRTFSGGEELTLDLKSQKRATIVGETTGGGAHPTGPHKVEEHFFVGVPSGRPINPITKGDWEGTGVAPDVKAPADDALDVAKKLALEAIAKNAPKRPPRPNGPPPPSAAPKK